MPDHQDIFGLSRRHQSFTDFSVTQTSYRAGTSLPEHSHPRVILSFAVEGGTAISLRGATEWCDQNSVLYLPAGVRHSNAYPEPATRLHLELTSRFWKTIVAKRKPRGGKLQHPIAQELRRAVLDAFLCVDNLAEFAVTVSLTDVIGVLEAKRRRAGNSIRDWARDSWLMRLRDYLDAHCTDPLSMETLVEIAGRHPVHVSREFRSQFGKTISEFIRERRVLRAVELVSRTALPLSEIALQCGFYDQSHFTNAFRRCTGTTPNRYRQPGVFDLYR